MKHKTISECITACLKGGVQVYLYVPVLQRSIPVAKGHAVTALRREKKECLQGGKKEINFTSDERGVFIDPRYPN